MKRIICIAVTVGMLICVTIFGCMKNDENDSYIYKRLDDYVVMEASTFDNLSVGNHNYEFVSRTEDFIKSNIPKDKFSLDGELLLGEYKKSERGYLYGSDTNNYVYKKGSLRIDYKINQSTGACDNYVWCDINYVSSNTEAEKTKDECLAIARQYLSNYVSDSEAYVIVEEKIRDIPEYKQLYNFEFVRKTGETLTSDKAFVGVTCFGKVVTHAFQSLGSLNDIGEPPEEIMNAVNLEVDQKLENIYGGVEGEYSVEYETDEVILSKMKNGKIALEYYVDVKLMPKQGGEELSEKNHFIVYLE